MHLPLCLDGTQLQGGTELRFVLCQRNRVGEDSYFGLADVQLRKLLDLRAGGHLTLKIRRVGSADEKAAAEIDDCILMTFEDIELGQDASEGDASESPSKHSWQILLFSLDVRCSLQ